jgi:hypothetical protein
VKRMAALFLAGALALVGCSGGSDPTTDNGIPSDCGLPTPSPGVRAELVPEYFVLEGAEIAMVQRRRGGYVAAINLPYSVTPALGRYREVLGEQGYEELGIDNEGFEAEVFFRSGKQIGQIQIRQSICEGATIAFVNVVSRETMR